MKQIDGGKMGGIRKNYFYNVLYQILLFITPFITAPYIARTVGAEGIGIYSYSYSIAYYFYIFGMLGAANYGSRSIAKVQSDKNNRTFEFWNIYAIQLILGLLTTGIYVVYVLCTVRTNTLIFLLQVFVPLSAVADISWFFFGMEQFRIIIPRNVLFKILNVLLMLVIVKTGDDLWKYTLLLSLTIFATHFSLWPFLTKFIGKPCFDLTKIKENIKPDLILFVPVLAISLYKVMDKVMLGNMCDPIQVGFYENAEKVINIPNGLITAFSTVMLPRMSSFYTKGKTSDAIPVIKKSCEFMMFLSCALAFGLFGVATDFTIVFYGKNFVPTISLIQIIAFTIIAQAISTIMRSLYLIPKGKDKSYIVSIFTGAGINLILNAILIPHYQAKGAAIATLVAELFVMIVQIASVEREVSVIIYIVKGFKYVAIGIAMVSAIQRISLDSALDTVIVRVMAGGLLYLTFSALLNVNNIVKTFENLKCKRKS